MSFRFQYPRTISEGRPGDFAPAAPKFNVRWDSPVMTVMSDYIAVQHCADDVKPAQDLIRRVHSGFDSEWGPDCYQEMRHVDDAGFANSIVVAYRTDPVRHAIWKHSNEFNVWFGSPAREAESVGYWRETLFVPYDRMETIFSEPYYRVGTARTHNCQLEAMYTAGYFGAMCNRLPIAAIDPLNSPYGDTAPAADFAGSAARRVRIELPHYS